MIRRLLSLFRRKLLTPETARDQIAAAMDEAVKDGLHGFCLATLFKPGTEDAQAVVSCKGDIQQGLARLLQTLLAEPDTKNATTMAIIAAIQANGGAIVQMPPIVGCDDPDCPICTMRRAMEKADEPTRKLH